jgi:uracil-DNA glycosylase family 4
MMQGFFEVEKVKPKKKKNTKRISGCESCKAYQTCKSPKLGVQGHGDKKILLIGDPVTKREDKTGRVFSDMSSAYLKEELRSIGIDMERDTWMLNSIQCHSEQTSPSMLQGCRRKLDEAIRELQPKKILLLGGMACDMFLGNRIEKSRIGMGNPERWYGMSAPDQEYGCWVHATYHPKFVLNALSERKRLMKKWGSYREQADTVLWKQPRLVEDDNFRIRSLYFKKYLKTIIHSKQFIKEDYTSYCSFVPTVEEAISLMVSMKRHAKYLFMDFETNCLLPYRDDSELYTVSLFEGTCSYSFPFFSDNKRFVRMFKKLMTDPDIRVGIANYGFEDMWTREKLGFTITNCYWDTVLASHILRPTIDSANNLKVNAYLVSGDLGYDAETDGYLKGVVDKDPYSLNRIKELPIKTVGIYNALDSYHTGKVAFHQMLEIEHNNRLNYIFRLYMEAQEMYSEFTADGIRIDEDRLIKNEIELEEKLVVLEYKMKHCDEVSKWYDTYPNEEFNFNSNEQLSKLFFGILGFDTAKKTSSGNRSIDKDVIEELSHTSEFAKFLAEYKKIFKLKNTELKGIKAYVHNSRIHPFIGVARASTGRSNSSSPNLQNLSGDEYALQIIRSCFLPDEGHEWIVYDYKSLEVYSSIGISKDKMMIKELEDPDEDSHTLMTQKFFGVDLEEAGRYILEYRDGHSNHSAEEVKHFIKAEMRQNVKSVNFCFQYGGSANRAYITLFEESLKDYHMAWFEHKGYTTVDALKGLCKDVHTYYWERYKMLKTYVDNLWEEYLTKGYVYSKFGFRVNGINSKTFIGNFNSQGSGFVLALLGNLKLWKTMKDKKYKSKMKLTVHDSTEFSIDPDEYFDGGMEQDIHKSLEGYVNRKVRWLALPLSVDPEYFDGSWGKECDRETLEKRHKSA